MSRFAAAITKSRVLIAFAFLCLAGGTTIGYFMGAADNKKGLSAVLLNNTSIRRDTGGVALSYSCKGRERAAYDLKYKRLILNDPVQLFGPSETFFERTYRYGIAVVGGGGIAHAVRYAKPILETIEISKPDKIKYFIVGILSAGSGLYLGYQLGALQLPSCEDERILTQIRQETFWAQVAKVMASDLWHQANFFDDLNEIPIDQRHVLINAWGQIVTDNVDAQLFTSLLDEIKENSRKLTVDPKSSWTLTDFLVGFLVFIPVLIILALGLNYFFPLNAPIPTSGIKKSPRRRR
jgi:hypothetical protein